MFKTSLRSSDSTWLELAGCRSLILAPHSQTAGEISGISPAMPQSTAVLPSPDMIHAVATAGDARLKWACRCANIWTAAAEVHEEGTCICDQQTTMAIGTAANITGSPLGLSRLNGDGSSSAKLVKFNRLPKSQLWIVCFQMLARMITSRGSTALPNLVVIVWAVAPPRSDELSGSCAFFYYFFCFFFPSQAYSPYPWTDFHAQ